MEYDAEKLLKQFNEAMVELFAHQAAGKRR